MKGVETDGILDGCAFRDSVGVGPDTGRKGPAIRGPVSSSYIYVVRLQPAGAHDVPETSPGGQLDLLLRVYKGTTNRSITMK